jgi:predicted dehydrogenase
MTLDPGHFHAALVQKTMYEQVSPNVHVYAPAGADLDDHLDRIEKFNTRAEKPTNWQLKVYKGEDFLQKMISEKPGNVMITSGNNKKKTEYIHAAVGAGINVLSDKPMCIDKKGFELLKDAFEVAEEKGVLLYDIMTERYEITTMLQKEIANRATVFGELTSGSPEDPSVTKESVHHLFKYVSGNPLKRPPWYFDTTQQGEGLVDVGTHLVDLVMWECFPEQIIEPADIEIIEANRWPTIVTREQFQRVALLDDFPEYLKPGLDENGDLPVFCNGEVIYRIRGIHAKVSVIWNYQAPEGSKDTHYSIMKGSKAHAIIRQEKEQNYRPELYVEPAPGQSPKALDASLTAEMENLQKKYPGIEMVKAGKGWHIAIPDKYRVGHEAHFGQVAEKYLRFLVEGKLPDWEVPNMIAKYYTTTSARKKSRENL